jgi:hypothetical protein
MQSWRRVSAHVLIYLHSLLGLLQAGSPVFMSNDDDMNITVDVNELQQAAASAPS